MKILGQSKKQLFLTATLAVAGVLFGYWLNADGSRSRLPEEVPAPSGHLHSEEETVYVCPMMCIPPRKAPGDCPICGMDLVAVVSEKTAGNASRVRIDPETARRAGIRTAGVQRRFVAAKVRLFGRIDYDPAHVTYINAYTPGLIDRVYVKRAGEFVRWGEPLFDIYSSDLLDTQKQLVEAMKYVPSFFAFQAGLPHAAREVPVQERLKMGSADPSPEVERAMKKIAGIRHKLSILGLPKRDIDALMKKGEATGIATVYSSVNGQVIDQRAFEGAFVNTGTPIFTIGDPRYVWVELDAYETDYPWLRKGQQVTFETDAYPGETFSAKVVYIDPVFNNNTRTFTLGAVSPDVGGSLKAGMLVRATIHAELTADGKVVNEGQEADQAPLVIPASAPLITGKRAVVYVKTSKGDDLYEGREVTLGPRAGDAYIVLGGLEEGEQVVEHGSFKVDSAVQITARPSMMSAEARGPAAAHHHPGGSDAMHENYWDQRMKSRQEVRSLHPESEMDAGEEQEVHRHRRETLQRRRPGQYGDSTRQRSRRYQ